MEAIEICLLTAQQKISLDIKINHSNDLKSLSIKINDVVKELKISSNITSTTFISDILRTSGNIKVIITAIDSLNNETKKELNFGVYEEDESVHEPTISYVVEPSIFLSEGEKLQFTGTSKNISDYQIIYAATSIDVSKATECCDVYQNSYFDVDKEILKTYLLDNKSTYSRYQILKDFDEDDVPFFLSDFKDGKYNILVSLRDKMTDKLIDDFAVVMDVVIPEGKVDARFEQLKICVRTRQKFESQHLR